MRFRDDVPFNSMIRIVSLSESRAALPTQDVTMNDREWIWNSILIGLILLTILFAQSRKNCEVFQEFAYGENPCGMHWDF
jgi:hypothetical protein